MRRYLAVVVACVVFGQAKADTVYVSRGEFGEVSFSDVASPGSRSFEMTASEPSAEQLVEADRQIRETLALADELAAARRARSEARAASRAAALVAEPTVADARGEDVYYRTVVGWPLRHHLAAGRPPHRGPHRAAKPGRPTEPPADELRMKFISR